LTKVEELGPGDLPLSIRAAGRGGTSFDPAFRWVEEQGIRPSCLVYLTDGECGYPSQTPNYPVLWAILPGRGLSAAQPPFGEVVAIE